eukprot:scaffold102890_cov27-Attheya_sp.AAC.1
MEVDGEDPATAEGEVATGTEDETPDTTAAGTTPESAVEVEGEEPARQVAGTNPESAIFLPGRSLSDSSDTTRDYTALRPPPPPF